MPGKLKQHDLIPVVNYGQYRRARKLVHECCNYDNGQCIALTRGTGVSVSGASPIRFYAVVPLCRQQKAL